MRTPRQRWGRLGIGIVLLLLCGAAILARSTTYPGVFFRDEVLLPGADAYYHLRRITYAVETGEGVPRHDLYQHFPGGAEAIWPPFFDAAWARILPVLVGSELDAVERAAPWIPPLLGGLAVLLVFLAARRLLPERPAVAWFAALALALLGGSIAYTRLGFVDHHAMQGVWAGLLIWLGAAALDRAGSGTGIAWAAGTGLALAAALLTWPGNLMLLAIWAASLALAAIASVASDRLPALLASATVSLFLCALLLAIGCSGTTNAIAGRWTLTTLSWLQPVIATMLGLLALGAWLGARSRLGPRRGGMVGTSLAMMLVGGGALLFTGGSLDLAISDSLRWLTKDEDFQASVVESLPLLQAPTGEWDFEVAYRQLSYGLWLVPIGGLLLAVLGGRRRRPSAALWITTFAALTMLTLLQRRFVDTYAVPASLALGMVLGWCWSLEPVRWRWIARSVTIALAALLFWPSEARLLEGLSSGWRDEATLLRSSTLREKWQLHRTAGWLRARTPETRGYFDVSQQPEWGVMCFWGRGHAIAYLGRRPVVVNNFGDDLGDRHFEDSQRFFATEDSGQALAILARYRCRYVVTEEPRDQRPGDALLARFGVRLHFGDGLPVAPPGRPPQPAIDQLRLCFETGPAAGRSREYSAFKVWERVPGALLAGVGLPGAAVDLVVRLQTNRGRVFEWRSSGECDASGRFALRCPYPTEDPSKAAVRSLGPIRISCAGLVSRVELSESAVRSGASIEVPALE